MSSEPPKDTPADRPTEPFARGQITWGRPPQTTFRVGPLPSGAGGLSAPRPAPRTDFLTGSMVPRARPAAPEEPVEASAPVEPDAIVPPPPLDPEPEPVIEPVFEPVAATPDPEPAVVEPEPEPIAAAPQEIVVEPEAAEPAVTVPPPLSSEPRPAVKPRDLPSVVVTPTLYASMGAAVQEVAKGGRWTIVAGVAALVIIGGFIWLATLPAPQPVDSAPTPPVVAAAPEGDPSPVEDTLPPVAASASAPATPAPTAAAPTASAPARVATAPRRPAPSAPIVAAPAETAPRPYIETAPLVIDPPTPAAPAQQDPDAPIATRPQPLD